MSRSGRVRDVLHNCFSMMEIDNVHLHLRTSEVPARLAPASTYIHTRPSRHDTEGWRVGRLW